MVGPLTAVSLVVGVGLLFANGFFVTMEYALTRLRQLPEHQLDSSRLRRAWEMTDRLEIYLSSSKLGITATSIGLGVVAEPALAETLTAGMRLTGVAGVPEGAAHAASASLVAFAIITLLHVVVGEQAPTYLGVERPRLVAGGGAPALHVWTRAMYPAIQFGDRIAKATIGLAGVEITRSWTDVEEEDALGAEDMRKELETVLTRSDLTDERRREVLSAYDIGRTSVADVLTPWDDVVTLSTDSSLSTAVERIDAHPHTRYPVVDGEGDPVGVLYTSALLQNVAGLRSGDVALSGLVVDPFEVRAGTAISDLVDQLQDADQELALVHDGGELAGVVTITDAFEAIAGQLEDPHDGEGSA